MSVKSRNCKHCVILLNKLKEESARELMWHQNRYLCLLLMMYELFIMG
jgi:hypothetical protein